MTALLLLISVLLSQAAETPSGAVEELLRADRSFASAATEKDVVSALSAMFSEQVIAPLPGGGFAGGKARAIDALRASPENNTSNVTWTPIRGGVSADGQHGFTFGYMTLRKPDGTETPLKYLAYWIKERHGWRVVGYKRRARPVGEVSLAMIEPSLPARIVPPTESASVIERHRASLAAAEKSFSDEAQRIGLGAAFTKYGRADAMNLGSPRSAAFVIGNVAIGRTVGDGTPTDSSPVVWAADHRVIVASSGDLGITFGYIRSNTTPDQKPIPFFTIWRRDSPADSWRYIAE